MFDLNSPTVFKPVTISRRGEITAWAMAVVVLSVLVIVRLATGRLVWGIIILTGLFFLAGASISLGNWVDRRTELTLDSTGIHFINGLRNVKLTWAQIDSIEVEERRMGKKVSLVGETGHFFITTFGQLKVGDKFIGETGFEEGEKILITLLENAALGNKETTKHGSYYYSRT